MKKTWMPTVVGILNIGVGACGLLVALAVSLVFFVVGDVMGFGGIPFWLPFHFTTLFSLLWVGLLAGSVLAIAGGICALQRKVWGLALAGSIATLFPAWLMGVASITLVALSKNEFSTGNSRSVASTNSGVQTV
jgi:hypothetical protein